MNILYITNHLNTGGITSYVLTLAKGLKRMGHNIYVASSTGGLLLNFIEEGITFLPIPIKTKSEFSPKIFFSWLKLLTSLSDDSIDIIHANSRTTQALAYLLSKKSGIPYVFTCHGFFKKKLSRQFFPCWGKKIIAISEPVRDHLIDDFKVEAKDIAVIHNGIDLDRFGNGHNASKASFKKGLGLSDGPVVGIVARLSDVKGHIYLIQAMRSVLEKIPQAQLLIVGEGRMRRKLAAASKRLVTAGSVFFIPSIKDTKDVLQAMDLFVMPSLKEGLGLALMEAMASGLAVIGSDVGGIKSLIKDGENGLLVRPADVGQLSQAITELLQNPERAGYLGARARVFINENFSQDKMVSETERVYLQCLGAAG